MSGQQRIAGTGAGAGEVGGEEDIDKPYLPSGLPAYACMEVLHMETSVQVSPNLRRPARPYTLVYKAYR